jgi:hypothetical protein
MTRHLAVPVALVATAAGLAGCQLATDVATDVTQTTAKLNAFGRTGDAPGWFHFEYARREHQLGTTRGRTTPERGPIPPETPPHGLGMGITETVTGLSPGRVYVDRVCGRQGAMATSVCDEVRSFFTLPSDAQDWVSADFQSLGPSSLVEVDAASSPSGRRADGLLTDVTNRSQIFEGRVTCLRVRGKRATVGAVGTYDADSFDHAVPPVAATELVTVVDDPGADEVRRTARGAGATPPDCRAGSFAGPSLLEGIATVHDAT